MPALMYRRAKAFCEGAEIVQTFCAATVRMPILCAAEVQLALLKGETRVGVTPAGVVVKSYPISVLTKPMHIP